ncbi:MAG: aldo/keto reductase [Chloroflexi bacterium]|nr:aldo/keto reductase [Chloroflexota bacterium]
MSNLPTAVLGRTGLEVTRLGYGAMELRSDDGDRAVSDEHSTTVLNAVLDAGINFIDTAVCYGLSEERIGKAIAHRRDEYFIATKCGCPAAPTALEVGGNDYGHENMEAGVDQSLRRMKTDHLDILQFHGTPAKSVLEEHDAIDTLQRLRDKGKIRFIASSSSIPNIRDHIEMGVFDAFQIPYSALSRSHEGVIAQSAGVGIGTIIRGGVAKGEPGVSGVSRGESWNTFEDACLGDLLEQGESKTAFILRFTLAHPDMHTTIVGTQNIDHLEENVRVATMNGPLPGDVYAEAKRRLDGVGETSED